ncbi:hypothetical protein C8046_17870 [Serinibacter arcticus]|uniref:WXG100 family type VII secretion target n=1 Tax=Serinibacter arcticus TaxID=1655435 RepID=A0A2U1ZZ09_9MICO|nr:hypothetical protein [Serinibacter arcticus]PWD52228.1 hypothetical protein C8046_17870 [Serinibacter arcticus]
MSTTVYGMDINAARDLVRVMTSDADTITQLTARLSQQLEGTPWYGPDAQRFRGDWQGQYVPALNSVVQALQENAQLLASQADDQERASS